MTQNAEKNKTEPLDAKRKRLRFRSWHRGTKEMDFVLGHFADKHVDGFSQKELALYDRLLNNSDPDLYNWLAGNEPVPPSEDNDVMQKFLKFKLAE